MFRHPRALIVAVTAVLSLAACSSDDKTPAATGGTASLGKLTVTVGFYPYEFVASRVGGPDVEVTNLTQPGAEPHDLELTPQQVAKLGGSDLVVYSRGFQPAVDKAVQQEASTRAFDVLSAVEVRAGTGEEPEGESQGAGESHAANEGAGVDPHVWLDPMRLAKIATAVAGKLTERRPDRAADFASRAAELGKELAALDSQMRAGLTSCARHEIVTSHAAFGYLAAAYGLEQVAIAGLSPEDGASPKRLAEVARFAREKGVTTIFFEEIVSPKVAESLAREVGAKATALSPLEGPPETGDYQSAMRTNLETLRVALGCS